MWTAQTYFMSENVRVKVMQKALNTWYVIFFWVMLIAYCVYMWVRTPVFKTCAIIATCRNSGMNSLKFSLLEVKIQLISVYCKLKTTGLARVFLVDKLTEESKLTDSPMERNMQHKKNLKNHLLHKPICEVFPMNIDKFFKKNYLAGYWISHLSVTVCHGITSTTWLSSWVANSNSCQRQLEEKWKHLSNH